MLTASLRLGLRVVPALGAAHIVNHSQCGRMPAVYCKTFKEECKDFDDTMGEVPKWLRITGRVVTGIALVSTGGAAALLLVPAYDATKAAFHGSIDRSDKAKSDAIGAAVGLAAAGVSIGLEAAAAQAAKQAAEEAAKQATTEAATQASVQAVSQGGTEAVAQAGVEACKQGVTESGKQGLVEAGKQSMCVGINQGVVEAGKEGGMEMVKEGARQAVKSGVLDMSKACAELSVKEAAQHVAHCGVGELVVQGTGEMVKNGVAGAHAPPSGVTATSRAGSTHGCDKACSSGGNVYEKVVRKGFQDAAKSREEWQNVSVTKPAMQDRGDGMADCTVGCTSHEGLKGKGQPDAIIDRGATRVVADMKHYTTGSLDTHQIDKLLIDKKTFGGTCAALVVSPGTRTTKAAAEMIRKHGILVARLDHFGDAIVVEACAAVLNDIFQQCK
mmetsp:Transcript_71271/g.202068  ORF Transcript_71271/g.202068 Transcript_71271/m.202068 type:complete len:443 (-) Transcript_71271:146-1474(-)